jgi:hypothetical protein
LKTGSLLADAFGAMLGMPLTLLPERAREVLRDIGAAGGAVAGVLEPTSSALDVFFCSDDGGWPGRARDDTDGFLRNGSVEAGVRS